MAIGSPRLLFFVVCALAHLITLTIAQQDFLYHFCSSTNGNYTTNSTYQANLNTLLSSILSNSEINYQGSSNSEISFYNFSAGQGSDKVNAIALCSGDLALDSCRSCINDSISLLTAHCPNQKEAIGWYDLCMLSYSNRTIFYTQTCQGKEGGRVIEPIGPSCSSWFENYLFYGPVAEYELTPRSPPSPPALLSPPPPPKINTTITEDLGRRNRKENRPWIPIAISVSTVTVVVLIGSFLWYMRRRNKRDKEEKPNSQEVRLIRLREGRIRNDYSYDAFQGENQVDSQELPLFPLDLTLEATRHFSDENKLGEGGFGPVYKGILADGKEIAVKRLSKTSGQGLREFKNEVTVIARLQHKNLVRLLGCCLEGNELLLIYEFMPNKSLDVLLFDSTRSIQLD